MKRWFEDPQMPPELRKDLLRSQAAGHDYDVGAKLSGLRAALADSSRQPLEGHDEGGDETGDAAREDVGHEVDDGFAQSAGRSTSARAPPGGRRTV